MSDMDNLVCLECYDYDEEPGSVSSLDIPLSVYAPAEDGDFHPALIHVEVNDRDVAVTA